MHLYTARDIKSSVNFTKSWYWKGKKILHVLLPF